MSEQELNIVVADQAHEQLPAEVNQNTVKSRIDALIEQGSGTEIDDTPELEHGEMPDKAEKPEGENLSESDIEGEIASLEADDKPDTEGLETDQDETPPETMDVKQLAEKLDIPIDELYAVKFPYGEGGDAITLGELKDAGIRAKTIDLETETLADERNSFVNDQMRSRAELQSIVSLLPEGIPPELMQQANYQRQLVAQRERTSLLETLPEWQDSGIEKIARGAISENLRGYGFQPIEIDGMLDHRLIKVLHDFTRMRQAIIEPRAKLQKLKKKRAPRGSRKPRGQEQVDQASAQRRTDLKGAINTLLPRG